MRLFVTSLANGQFIILNVSPRTTQTLMSAGSSSPTWSQNFIFLATALHVKQSIPSTSRRALGGPTVKPLNKNGRISTLQLCRLGRWGPVLATSPWTTAGTGGIGKKSWEWVWPTRLCLYLLMPKLKVIYFFET